MEVECKNYCDRNKMNAAYEIMIAKFQEMDPNENRRTVTKKKQ